MKKMMILTAILLALALVAGAFAETALETSMELSFNSNPSTGYVWTAFILSGDSMELVDGAEGVYISDDNGDAVIAGAGGRTVFKLQGVRTGLTLIRFVYSRPWENEIAEQRVYLIHVDEEMCLNCEDVTESGIIAGNVISVDPNEMTVLLGTETMGEVTAQFQPDAVLPVQDEQIVVYTDGIMATSLPGIVNVLAWESLPSELARKEMLPSFGALTDFDAFADLITYENPVVSVYYEDGSEEHIDFTVENADEIQALLNAIAQMEVNSISEMMVTDSYPLLQMRTKDGREWSIGFEGRALFRKGESFDLSGDEAFWKLISQLKEEYGEA